MEEKYPEDIIEFIEEILKELNLFQKQQRGILELEKIEDPKKRLQTIENLPGAKLARIIRKLVMGEISQTNLDFYLKETLEISKEEAKEVAEKILKKVFQEKEIEKKEGGIEKKVRDIYREPI